jgi:DNA-binding NarL/FixJ family response regulator
VPMLGRPSPSKGESTWDPPAGRGGNRQLNAALHRIAITQARIRPGARAYLERKRAEGKAGAKRSAASNDCSSASSSPLKNGERVVGVFGLIDEQTDDTPTAPPPHLTPRQVEVLRLLEQGRSTKQIAAELHLSTETVRNHIRRLFRALGVNSRLEAVAARYAPPD